MNLIVYRNHDGHLRMLRSGENYLSVGQILVTDLKMAFDPVLSLRSRIHPEISGRVEDGIFHISQLLALHRSLWHCPVKGLAKLPLHLKDHSLVSV